MDAPRYPIIPPDPHPWLTAQNVGGAAWCPPEPLPWAVRHPHYATLIWSAAFVAAAAFVGWMILS